jgi:Leishmanolysin
VGPNAIAGFLEVNGKGTTIPVEEDGGPGTRGSHWDDESFDTNLMTGFIALGDSPLSVMTISSLQDLGYVVNYAPADRYQVHGRQERQDDGTATASVLINLAERERLVRPLAVVK